MSSLSQAPVSKGPVRTKKKSTSSKRKSLSTKLSAKPSSSSSSVAAESKTGMPERQRRHDGGTLNSQALPRRSSGLTSETCLNSTETLQPNKKSIKKKKKMPIDFSVGTSSSSSSMSPLAMGSHNRERRRSGFERSDHDVRPASNSAPKDTDDASDGPRDETVVNQLAMPKRIVKKKKKSSLAVEAINFGADDDFQHGGMQGDETKQDTNFNEKANSDQVHELDGTGEQGKSVKKDEDIEYDDDFEDYDDDFDDHPPARLESKDITRFSASMPPAKSPKAPVKKKINPFAPQIRRLSSKDDGNPESQPEMRTKRGAFKREIRKPMLRTSSRKDDRDDLQTLDHGGSEVGIRMSNAGGRGADIRSRVTFRSVRFDHFEMHSLPAWEFYMRSVAAGGNKRQAFAQTNEDNREVDTQTDDIIRCTVAIDQDGVSHAVEEESSRRVANISGKNDEERRSLYRGREDCIGPLERDTDEHDANLRAKHAVDIEIEAAILRKMELMCVATLEENVATSWMKKFHLDRSRATGALSKEIFRDYHRLGTRMPGLAMASRKVVSITASSSLHKVFLSVHGQCSLEDVLEETKSGNKIEARRIAKSSILCLWDLRLSASSPQFFMACVGAATCGLLSPGSAVVALAGMEDGTLFAWDLRGLEPSDLQASSKQSFKSLLPPSYSTAGETALARTHLAPICDISLVSSAPTSVSQIGFQVASLDLDGRIHIWSILHKSTLLAWDLDDKSKDETMSDPNKPQFTSDVEGANQRQNADLGALCGELRLHHMAMIDTLGHGIAPDRLVIGRATVAAFQPGNADRIVVGSSDGRIRHVSRSGLRFVPREFSSSLSPSFSFPYSDALAESSGDGVTALAFNPFLSPFFLAGFSSGAIALFHIERASPIKVWKSATKQSTSRGSGYAAVRAIAWSRRCASSFFVLDEEALFHVWDLATQTSGPLVARTAPDATTMMRGSGAFNTGLSPDIFVFGGSHLSFAEVDDRISQPFIGMSSTLRDANRENHRFQEQQQEGKKGKGATLSSFFDLKRLRDIFESL